jgi:hypothetical protein
VASMVAGTVSQVCQRVGQSIGFGLVVQESIGVTTLFQEWRCTGKAMSNTRQSPSRTGRVSKELQLSSDLMHIPTGLGCRVADV